MTERQETEMLLAAGQIMGLLARWPRVEWDELMLRGFLKEDFSYKRELEILVRAREALEL